MPSPSATLTWTARPTWPLPTSTEATKRFIGEWGWNICQPQQLCYRQYTPAVAVGDFNGDGRPDLAVGMVAVVRSNAGVLLGVQTESATAAGASIPGSGTQNVFASHSGDADYDSSFSSTLALAGSGTSTTVTVGATPNPMPYGQTPSVVATLTPSNATGIGSANFTAFLDGTTVLTVTATGGNQFQITGAALSTLSVGPHTIQVNFEGTADYLASSGNVNLQVNQDTSQPSVGAHLRPLPMALRWVRSLMLLP